MLLWCSVFCFWVFECWESVCVWLFSFFFGWGRRWCVRWGIFCWVGCCCCSWNWLIRFCCFVESVGWIDGLEIDFWESVSIGWSWSLGRVCVMWCFLCVLWFVCLGLCRCCLWFWFLFWWSVSWVVLWEMVWCILFVCVLIFWRVFWFCCVFC